MEQEGKKMGVDGMPQSPSVETEATQWEHQGGEEGSLSPYRWKTWALLGILCLWGYGFIAYPPLPGLAVGAAAFGGGIVAVSLWYLRACGRRLGRTGWMLLTALGLVLLSFALFENKGMAPQLLLFAMGLYALWLLAVRRGGPLQGWDVARALRLLMIRPFTGLHTSWKALQVSLAKGGRVKPILVGLVAALPVAAIALALLMSADAAFEGVMQSIGNALFVDVEAMVPRMVGMMLIGGYLFSMLINALVGRHKEGKPRMPSMNAAVLGVMLGTLCVLYALFVGVRVVALLQLTEAGRQSASYYSGLARDGFFELPVVALLNLVVFLCGRLLVKEKPLWFRVLLSALCVLTQLVIVTAIAKMGAYMQAYGLTLLRVQTTWLMASMLLAFGVLAFWQWKPIPAFRWVAALCVVSVVCIAYANVGGLVARVNVDRYLSGTLEEFSIKQYRQFGYEAAPQLIRLYKGMEGGAYSEKTKEEVGQLLWLLESQDAESLWDRSLQQQLAAEELRVFLEEHGHEITPPSAR